jgi:RNA polymerase sigma factor (sigma-70 family)
MSKRKEINFLKVVTHAARKDFAPLERNFEQISSLLVGFLHKRFTCLDGPTAESIAQSTLVTLMEKAPTCKATNNSGATNWVLTIAANQAKAYIRKTARLSKINPDYKEHAHADTSADQAKIEFAALADTPFHKILTEREIEVLELYCQGFRNVDIARKLDLSKPRITQLIKSAKQKLEEHFEQ